jgi:hypothetical protein
MAHIDESSGTEQAKRAGGWLLVILLGIAVVIAILGLFLLGPLGLLIGIPVAIVLALLFGASSGGPAAGA